MRFLLALLLLCLLPTSASAGPAIAFFYGSNPPWDELQAFDIVVVDPDHVPDPAVPALTDTRLAAYVSVGEVQPSRSYANAIPKKWLAGENRDWGSLLIDQSQPEWPRFFAETVIAPLWRAGYRDFFLDTLDSYQRFATTDAARKQQEDGLVALVNEFKQRYPDARLIFNRGFEILDRTHDKVFAVAAESLFRGYDAGKSTYRPVNPEDREWLLGALNKARNTYRLPVISIDYVPPEQHELARETARKIEALGFIPWVAAPDLATLGVGQVEVMPRRILVVHSMLESEYALRDTPGLLFAAMPLNYLGYVPEYADVRHLPDTLMAGRYAGVVVWLSALGNSADSQPLSSWLGKIRQQGLPIAILGQMDFAFDTPLGKTLGLERKPVTASFAKVDVVQQAPMMGFEAQPRPQPREFNAISLAQGEPLLTLERNGLQQVAAAITPWGGYVTFPYAVTTIPTGDESRWVIDPFAFFRAALRLPDMPVPDVSTESGRRMLLVHMDGDGFANRSELPGKPFSSQVILDRVVRKYQLPMTMSVIEGELAPDGLYPQYSAQLEEIAREIFREPNVEIASHTYSHPFIWAGKPASGTALGMPGNVLYHLPVKGYRFNLQRELEGSIHYIESRLAPPGKKVALFLWSGDCTPGRDALESLDRLGILNMNGGETVATFSHLTLTQVGGLGVDYGGYFQVFAPNQNENVFTHNWRGPYYGYERTMETFAITEKPRRLKPINIYFHTFIASKRAGLESLDKVFAYALAQKTTPVFASEYARKAREFSHIAIARSAHGWRVRGAHALRTLRARASLGEPDAASSNGVAGYNKANGATYIHLAAPAGEIAFGSAPDREPLLVSANASVESGSRDSGSVQWQLAGHVPLQFDLANVSRCRVTVDGSPITPSLRKEGIFHYQLTSHVAGSIKALCRN